MNRRLIFVWLLVAVAMLLPFRSPAPLYYSPGEGWYYEPYGEKANWQRPRAKEQLDVAEQSFTNGEYNVALHAAHRVVRVWPLSDYAPRAEYLVGRCFEVKHRDEAAFNAYEAIVNKYPHSSSYDEVSGGNMRSPTVFWRVNGSGCGASSRFIPRWTRRRTCSRRS